MLLSLILSSSAAPIYANVRTGGCSLPYELCLMQGKVWNGVTCVDPHDPFGQSGFFPGALTPNEAGALHNAVLENDWNVRQDGDVTEADAIEFLTVASEFYCQSGCDAGATAALMIEVMEPMLADGVLEDADIVGLMEQEVVAGLMSPELSNELASILSESSSGGLNNQALATRIDGLLDVRDWDAQDTESILMVRGVAHASYVYWGAGNDVAKETAPVDKDALVTVIFTIGGILFGQPEITAAAPVLGALASTLFDKGDPQPARPAVFDGGNEGDPVYFEEAILVREHVVTLQGVLGSPGGWLELYGEDGSLLAVKQLQAWDASLPLDSSSTEGRVVLPVWTMYGYYVVAVSEEGGVYSID